MPLKAFAGLSAGAAEAVGEALRKLTGRPVAVTISEARLLRRPEDFPRLDPELRIAAVYLPVTGRLRGAALLWFPFRTACALCELLTARIPGAKASGEAKGAMAESALKEAGNIICGNYLSVLANRLHATAVPGLPHLARDMSGAVTEQVIAGLWVGAREPLLHVEIRLEIGREAVEGQLCVCVKTGGLLETDAKA